MLIFEVTGIALLIIAGVLKSVMDRLSHGKMDEFIQGIHRVHPKLKSWFDYPSKTSKNKYKESGKAKFPGSTTVFVFLTDVWHFTQFFMYKFLMAGVIIMFYAISNKDYELWVEVGLTLFYSICYFNGAFELFYDQKGIVRHLKSPGKVLIGLITLGSILGLLYNFSENPYVLRIVEGTSLLIIIFGGITAIGGFIYGMININK